MKILIVEDQVNLARLIKDGLEAEGHLVDFVLDGQEALDKIELIRDYYNLVLLDNMMPKKNGLEVCRTCREKNIATPIWMLTAKDSPDDIVSGLDSGANNYLVKPFSFAELLNRIAKLEI